MTAAPDQHVLQAAAHLRATLGGDKPLLSAALGLRALIETLASGGALDPQLVGETSRLLFAAAPRVVEAAAGRIAPEHVFTAMGCANAAMTCREPKRYGELLAFAAVLEAEIRALHLRDIIAAGTQRDLALALSRSPVIAAPYLAGPLTVH